MSGIWNKYQGECAFYSCTFLHSS